MLGGRSQRVAWADVKGDLQPSCFALGKQFLKAPLGHRMRVAILIWPYREFQSLLAFIIFDLHNDLAQRTKKKQPSMDGFCL